MRQVVETQFNEIMYVARISGTVDIDRLVTSLGFHAYNLVGPYCTDPFSKATHTAYGRHSVRHILPSPSDWFIPIGDIAEHGQMTPYGIITWKPNACSGNGYCESLSRKTPFDRQALFSVTDGKSDPIIKACARLVPHSSAVDHDRFDSACEYDVIKCFARWFDYMTWECRGALRQSIDAR